MTSPSRRFCSAQLAMMIPTSSDNSRQPSTTAAITPCSQSGRQPSWGSRYTFHTALAAPHRRQQAQASSNHTPRVRHSHSTAVPDSKLALRLSRGAMLQCRFAPCNPHWLPPRWALWHTVFTVGVTLCTHTSFENHSTLCWPSQLQDIPSSLPPSPMLMLLCTASAEGHCREAEKT